MLKVKCTSGSKSKSIQQSMRIVLRRVIEDRAAILALMSKAAENESELMKAKSRQVHITKILNRQDQDIANLASKCKHALAEYSGKCKQYIRSFMLAFFENGDMDGLPQHPFVPHLEELEQATNRHKATIIEKVQADNHVKKLQLISSQDSRESCHDGIEKEQRSFPACHRHIKTKVQQSSETWLGNANKLIAAMPRHA